jgi:catechol 2,3-dioxygenase-like lactoylglutathione lyase family enzyme
MLTLRPRRVAFCAGVADFLCPRRAASSPDKGEMPMARGLDHVVHVVRDLDVAAELYRRLGFTVGTRNRHPWGTHNHIVQLPGFFIELLTFAEPEKLGTDGFSRLFAAYNRDFAARHDGLSMLILESTNAAADSAAFAAAGIDASPAMHFEREGKRPDGTPVKVGFSLAFAEATGAPDIYFATCQQHYPENFWNPAYQQHANGLSAIEAVLLVAQEPDPHRKMLLDFTGAGAALSSEGGYTIPLPRGEIEVMAPAAFRARTGASAPEVTDSARLAALRFRVRTLEKQAEILQQASVAYERKGNDIVVGPAVALGATLLFTAAG